MKNQLIVCLAIVLAVLVAHATAGDHKDKASPYLKRELPNAPVCEPSPVDPPPTSGE